jgi:SAM-dependent methyltransferase
MRAAQDSRATWHSLVDAASAPYRKLGRCAWHFAHGKLGGDPIFRYLLQRGLIPPRARVLDIGCGQGLLASLLRAAETVSKQGHWPADWAAAPVDAHVTGIERMRSDVERGRVALGDGVTFVCADLREAAFPASDAVVILDVLHYISAAQQDHVLARVRGALADGGSLLLRIADAGSRRRFAISLWVDRLVILLRGGGFVQLAGRPLALWVERLRRLGFKVDTEPMNGRLPFANVLLVARVVASAQL